MKTVVLALFLLGVAQTLYGSSIRLPLPLAKATAKYFWYPKDDGTGVVPAFLEGSTAPQADERDIHFYLYTKSNPNSPQELFVNDLQALLNSNFKFGAPTKVISHGFSSTSVGGSAGTIKNAYMSHHSGDVNVILIDWGKLAAAPWYDAAAENTRLVGTKTARFLEFLVDNKASAVSDFHLSGHSLGAHVCGFAGSGLLVGKLPRITALDPALPLFGNVGDNDRIDPTDAVFVDVIHTAGGPLIGGELGFMDPRGRVDFYPNGGKDQPGCSGIGETVGACSHSRSYEYFAESLGNNNFKACKCPSWENFSNCDCGNTAYMGAFTSTSASGYYYLTTNSGSPFAQG